MPLSKEEQARLAEKFSEFYSGSNVSLYGAIGRYAAKNIELFGIFEDFDEIKQRPVTLFAAVHYLVLKNELPELQRIYEMPTERYSLEHIGPIFAEVCKTYREKLVEIMQQRDIQTNETNRCMAYLPALMTAQRKHRKPLAFVELGASAGLNLMLDQFHYEYTGGISLGPSSSNVRLETQLRGRTPRMYSDFPPIEYRAGLDVKPIDLNNEDEVLWMKACTFVGENDRIERLISSIDMARKQQPNVVEGDVLTQLESLLEDVPRSLELCIASSWMMGWMSSEQRNELSEIIHRVAQERNVAWITFEPAGHVPGLSDPDDHDGETVLGLQEMSQTSVKSRVLAICHRHARWIDWVDNASSAW